jgi:hypothetical protein
MNPSFDVDLVLREYLADDGLPAPDRVLRAVEQRIDRQRQRRAWRLQGRPFVNTFSKLAAGAAALVVVAIAGYSILPRPGTGPGSSPSPTPGPTAPRLPDGHLQAGDYAMRVVPGDSMTFVITAPKGWTGFGGFFLGGTHESGAPDGVGISVNHDPEVVTTPCDASLHTPAPGASPRAIGDLVSAITSRQDLQVSGVADTVLAGYAGKRLDIQFPAALACANHYVFAEPKGLYANGPANHWRIWLLDVDGQTAVVVLLDYAATPAADRAAAEAAIESIRITP